MPYGCGEQNMINFAPNIYVLDYLTKKKQLTENLKEKALSFMRQGKHFRNMLLFVKPFFFFRQSSPYAIFQNKVICPCSVVVGLDGAEMC